MEQLLSSQDMGRCGLRVTDSIRGSAQKFAARVHACFIVIKIITWLTMRGSYRVCACAHAFCCMWCAYVCASAKVSVTFLHPVHLCLVGWCILAVPSPLYRQLRRRPDSSVAWLRPNRTQLACARHRCSCHSVYCYNVPVWACAPKKKEASKRSTPRHVVMCLDRSGSVKNAGFWPNTRSIRVGHKAAV